MNTFTAKITIPGKDHPKYIPNCTLYKGKLVQVTQRGVGTPVTKGGMFGGEGEVWEEYPEYKDAFKAYFNSTLFESQGLSKEMATKALEEDQDLWMKDDRFFNCMFEMGKNPNGYEVSNYDEHKANQEAEKEERIINKEEPIRIHSGIFGFTVQRLPRQIWNIIQPFGTYHRGDDSDQEWAEDMGDYNVHRAELKGWFYTEKAIEALLAAGYKLLYKDQVVENPEDISRIDNEIAAAEKRYAKAERLFIEKKDKLKKILSDLFNDGIYITMEEADQVSKTEEILFHNLDITGADIYGGGSWLHLTEDAFFLVENNGHDGDDWSRNNYGTGGAGAICYKIPKNAKVIYFLQEAKLFEEQKIEDFILNQEVQS